MSRARSYRDLRVYQEAFHWAMVVKGLVESFPADERFDLVRQLRRSSRSVCANIAEAWRRRVYPASFVAKLIDAEAEASETRVHLEFAEACGYLTPETVEELDAAYDAILARVTAMRARPERWGPLPTKRARPTTPGGARRSGEPRTRAAGEPDSAPRTVRTRTPRSSIAGEEDSGPRAGNRRELPSRPAGEGENRPRARKSRERPSRPAGEGENRPRARKSRERPSRP